MPTFGYTQVDRSGQRSRIGEQVGSEVRCRPHECRLVNRADEHHISRDGLPGYRLQTLLEVLGTSTQTGRHDKDVERLIAIGHPSIVGSVPVEPTTVTDAAVGRWMHDLATELFPINRSITGDGVRQTLAVLQQSLSDLRIHEVPSGTEVLDWTIPREWVIRSARLTGPEGTIIADMQDSNIHVMNYSTSVNEHLPLERLQAHLHSLPELPEAIPYVTSYYSDNWGFCLTHSQREELKEGTYHAFIDSEHIDGSLTYADLVIPGQSSDEILISTYVCHPSLGNNELSGPVVATALARWISEMPQRKFTYRFVFAPETIGAITYIAQHREHLRDSVLGAINLTCIGDDGDWSYLASREGTHLLDRIARRVVHTFPRPVIYSYLDRGSDERHYGMPGVGVPTISLMRTKYGVYPEYHTSLDDLSVITPSGLHGGLALAQRCIQELESGRYFVSTVLGEPQLGKRGLYHRTHARTVSNEILLRTHILAYSDGRHSTVDIAEMTETPLADIHLLVDELIEHDLLRPTAPLKFGL